MEQEQSVAQLDCVKLFLTMICFSPIVGVPRGIFFVTFA